MRGFRQFCLALSVTLFLPACAPSATQLIVSVDTDLPVRTAIDRVTVSVSREGTTHEESGVLNDRRSLPLTLSVIPEDGESLGPIRVTATGYLASEVVVTRSATVTLVRGETRVLPLFLLADCRDIVCPRAGDTCGEEGCVPEEVDPMPWTGTPPTIGMDAGLDAARLDGAVDGAVRDGGRDAPIATDCTEDGDCDDGAACTADTCNAAGSCEHVGSDAACDDGNPCTTDACEVGGCVHPAAVGVSCEDSLYCNGLDTCGADGACSVHGGDPCGGGACVEASDTCDVVCGSRADCPADSFGAWGACDYGDGCDESATRSRTARRWSCVSSACVSSDETDSEPCTRDTDGTTCGAGSCGGWGSCGGFSDTCDESGTESRTCSDVVCTAGSCGAVMRTENRACSRSTGGTMCAASSCGGWGSCGGYSDACDESGTQSRTCNDYACAGGTCAASPRSENQACSRDTDGASCGSTSCGAWSTCVYSTECDETGSQSRTCTDRICSAGSCGSPTRTETNNSCSTRDTDGVDCGDDFDCQVDRCSAGSCNFVSGGCTGGRQCCYPGCFTICP